MRILAFGVCLLALSPPAPAILGAQAGAAGATIAGHVVDGGTQVPIAGARVMLVPVFNGRPTTPPSGPPPSTITGDDGAYLFSGVAAGRYRVQVQKIGFVSPTDTPLLTVDAGQALAGPELRLNKGAVVTGRVLDARGEPLPEVMVTAMRRPTAGSGRGRGPQVVQAGQSGQTNDVGEFRITGLTAGDYYVAASPRPESPFGQASPSSGTTLVTTYYPGVTEIAGAQVVAVPAGQTISGLEFRMLSAPAFTISGIVVDEMSRPIGDAMVMAMPAALVGPGPRGSGRTQADGTFRIGNVTPGTYRLTASVPVTISSGAGGVGGVSGGVVGGVSGGVTSGGGGFVTFSGSSGPAGTLQVTVGDADVAGVTLVARR